MTRTATGYYKGKEPAHVLRYVLALGLRKEPDMTYFVVVSGVRSQRQPELSKKQVWSKVLNTDIPSEQWKEGKMRDYHVWYVSYPEKLDVTSTP